MPIKATKQVQHTVPKRPALTPEQQQAHNDSVKVSNNYKADLVSGVLFRQKLLFGGEAVRYSDQTAKKVFGKHLTIGEIKERYMLRNGELTKENGLEGVPMENRTRYGGPNMDYYYPNSIYRSELTIPKAKVNEFINFKK